MNIAELHAQAFEQTWKAAGSETAVFGRKTERVIGTEITEIEDYDENNTLTRIRTGELTIIEGSTRYRSGTGVTYAGEKFRITESRKEGRAARVYTIQSP